MKTKIKTRTIVANEHVYFVVSDPMSGRRHVYTVYRISLVGNKLAEIIGRELPLPYARRVIRRYEAVDKVMIRERAYGRA
jgi:hypothetical protein